MKRSEKLLLSVLVVSLAAFVVLPAIWQAFRGPVTALEGKVTDQRTLQTKAEQSLAVGMSRLQQLGDYKQQSLSSNAAAGALAYQQWVTDVAEIVAKFPRPEVVPETITPSRDKTYSVVRLRLNADVTVDQLRAFLYRFYRANLLHRVAGLNLEALNNSSRPTLRCRLTLEAVSMRDADEKGSTLFPRVELAEAIERGTDETTAFAVVASSTGFPAQAPFEVRIGDGYAQVVDISTSRWKLQLPEGQSLTAKAGDVVELSPVHADFAELTLADFDALIEHNPFAKPSPYLPTLDLIGDKVVQRGAALTLTARAAGFDATAGPASFKLGGTTPPGLTLDGDRISWQPSADQASGEYPIEVTANAAGLREPLTKSFTVTLRDVNAAPTLDVPADLTVMLGQPLEFTLAATDTETPTGELQFALAGEAPAGLTLDAETGVVKFAPAAGGQPGDVTVSFSVTDRGTPAQTTTMQATIKVQDDVGQFTRLTGVVAADDNRQAWLRDISSNRQLIVREGEKLQYAGLDAVVLTIGNDFMLYQQKLETLRLEIGQNLRQAVVIARAEPTATPTDGTEPAAGQQPGTVSPSAESGSGSDKPVVPAQPADNSSAASAETPAAPARQPASGAGPAGSEDSPSPPEASSETGTAPPNTKPEPAAEAPAEGDSSGTQDAEDPVQE